MDDSGSTTATEERDYVYKGKATNRSWPQLPEEIIRLIGTYYLQSFTATAYVPYTWESYDHWQQRILYVAIRDGMTLERNVMSVCVGWHRALQTHYTWTRSISLLDPTHIFAPYMYVPQAQHSSGRMSPQTHRHSRAGKAQMQTQLTPWRHFRNILSCCCLVCRMNSPSTGYGFMTSNGHRRPMVYTAYLSAIPVCRDHEKRKVSFCGACLRDNPTFESATLQSLIGFGPGINPATALQQHQDAISAQIMDIACNENEDEEMWPGIEATCKTCRLEWLWRKACYQPLDREAIGGPPPPNPPHNPPWLPIPSLQTLLQNSPDWEIRHAVEGFVDMAEGTISEVLTLAREKYWLQKHTRLRELMSQALAARRWVSSAAGESVMGGVGSRGEVARVTSHERPYEPREEVDPPSDVQDAVEPDDPERAQLALDMELAIQLEREEAETEEGEYNEAAPRQVRPASPPVERPLPPHMQQRDERRTYEPPATIQLSSEPTTYNSEPSPGTNTTGTTATVISLDDTELERFDEVEDDARSQTYAQSDLSDDHFDEEEEEEEEEDASILQTVEKDVVLLALEDWTRSKILDGYWISPADVWFNHDTIYKRQHLDVDTEFSGEAADARKAGWTLATHPCSWAIERDGDGTSSDSGSEESHPRWSTVVEQGPVTFSQARQAYDAHQRQLQTILLPAMRNIVRKIVIECGADAPLDGLGRVDTRRRPRTESTASSSSSGSAGRKRKRSVPPGGKRRLRDPVLIATRMTLEDVVRVLREEEGVWFDGFDWLEKRRNVREAEDSAAEKRKREESRLPQAATTPLTESPPKKRRKTQDGEEDEGQVYGTVAGAGEGVVEEDGTSSGSGTSPVLSTSTLQTTPSPPPSNVPLEREDSKGKAAVREEEEESDEDYDDEPPVRIPVAPVLQNPRMLRPIPYIPLSIAGFPQHTIQTLSIIWRQALAILFQCRCRICLRAIAAAEAEKAARRPAGSPTHYIREADRRETYERERTAPPPPSPRRDGRETQQPYRIPAIRLRPVKPDVPRERPEEEEEEEEEEEAEEEEEYETASADDEEFMKLAAEDPTFEKIIYHPPDEDEDDDDAVVEIDIGDVDVFTEPALARTPPRTTAAPPPGIRFAADGTPATPVRSARKRSCDDQEREVDHNGKTVSVLNADDAVPRAVSAVAEDLREYAVRPPSPPKRQKTTAS